MPKKSGGLLRALRENGIDDASLRKDPRGQDMFDVLQALGVESPQKQLLRFIRDELQGDFKKENVPATVSFGPYTQTQTLGFLNKSKYRLVLDDEAINGDGSIASRQKNGTSITAPVSLDPGDLYEVQVSHSSGRVYVSYDVNAKPQADGSL